MGPDGTFPSLLVFRAIPRPERERIPITKIERAHTIEGEREEIEKQHAKRTLEFDLRKKQLPIATTTSEELRRLPPGARVMIYRTKPHKLEGPHKSVIIYG